MATRTKINPFTASASIEAWLNSFGVDWDGPVEIPIGEFNVRDSRKNQARDTAIVEEAVDTYLLSMRNGDIFPAVIAFSTANGYVFIDGVNRHQAASKFGATHITTYVVSPDAGSQIIAAMTSSANVMNGAAVAKEWRVIQAENLHRNHDFALEKACALLSVRQSDVRSYQKLLQANENAQRCGISIKLWETLSNATRLALHSINNMVVFEAASRVVLKYNVSPGAPVQDFVRKTREELRISEAQALEYIEEYSKFAEKAFNKAKQQGRTRASAPQLGFITGVGKILHTDPKNFNRSFITDNDREEMSARIEQTLTHLSTLLKELKGRDAVTKSLLEIASNVERG